MAAAPAGGVRRLWAVVQGQTVPRVLPARHRGPTPTGVATIMARAQASRRHGSRVDSGARLRVSRLEPPGAPRDGLVCRSSVPGRCWRARGRAVGHPLPIMQRAQERQDRTTFATWAWLAPVVTGRGGRPGRSFKIIRYPGELRSISLHPDRDRIHRWFSMALGTCGSGGDALNSGGLRGVRIPVSPSPPYARVCPFAQCVLKDVCGRRWARWPCVICGLGSAEDPEAEHPERDLDDLRASDDAEDQLPPPGGRRSPHAAGVAPPLMSPGRGYWDAYPTCWDGATGGSTNERCSSQGLPGALRRRSEDGARQRAGVRGYRAAR